MYIRGFPLLYIGLVYRMGCWCCVFVERAALLLLLLLFFIQIFYLVPGGRAEELQQLLQVPIEGVGQAFHLRHGEDGAEFRERRLNRVVLVQRRELGGLPEPAARGVRGPRPPPAVARRRRAKREGVGRGCARGRGRPLVARGPAVQQPVFGRGGEAAVGVHGRWEPSRSPAALTYLPWV